MFAFMAAFVIYSINRTALYQQKWQEQRSPQAPPSEQARQLQEQSSISGGRYGSKR
jgi:hypothetical protein